ncbi:hypothetical protein Pfo_017596 [Paulownia fortunei]|nr:hypothetical protein Pfo_017596 [Paulownia fortunei]
MLIVTTKPLSLFSVSRFRHPNSTPSPTHHSNNTHTHAQIIHKAPPLEPSAHVLLSPKSPLLESFLRFTDTVGQEGMDVNPIPCAFALACTA